MEQNLIDTQNHQQMLAYELVANTNNSFFLTGRAGTGKTTFLRNIQQVVNKQFIILAPTGIAAILAGGETIHSFFGLPLEVCTPCTCGKMNDARRLALIHADTIIIDEVSMVRCDILDAIDYTMRKVLRNPMPFGGKQVVFVGDMFQLPPVIRQGPEHELLYDIYNVNDFFFYQAYVIKRMRMAKIEFQKVYRQDNDQTFLRILNEVRDGNVTSASLSLLNQRVMQPTDKDMMYITLTSLNRKAKEINNQHLAEIDAEEYVYEGTVKGKFECNRLPVEQSLHLKVGAQVMFTRNDLYHRWANGTIGKINNLTNEEITVELSNGEVCTIPKCTWDSVKYEYNREERKMKKEIVGTFTQFPLKLAWAITIHKSQGSTFDNLYIDLSDDMFAPGQLYVALSRIRSLNGLFLSRDIKHHQAQTSQEILNYAKEYNNEKAIDNEIESGKAVYEYLKVGDYDNAAKQYLILIEKEATEGNFEDCTILMERFFETVICDEQLYGCVSNATISDKLATNQEEQVLVMALLNLYSCHFEEAIAFADTLLQTQYSQEALYIKSRALAKQEQFTEADNINALLGEHFDMSIPDAKVLYMIAMMNELYIGEPGLELMRKLVRIKPRYNQGIISLRMLMKRRNIVLEAQKETKLVEAFKSDMSDTEFEELLNKYKKDAPQMVSDMLQAIKDTKLE